jgi:hypothetical protein
MVAQPTAEMATVVSSGEEPAPLNDGLNERRRRLLDLWKRHNDHYGRSATGRAAVPTLPPPWTGYPQFCAASRWGATAGLSHGR